ncbi:MAG: hypothetical protein R3F39_09840 [Myxococcota bacterium]
MAKGKDETPQGYRPGEVDPSLVRDAVHTDLRVISRFKAPAKTKRLPPPNAEFTLAVMGRPTPEEGPPKAPVPPNTEFEVKVWRPRPTAKPVQGIGSRRPPGG